VVPVTGRGALFGCEMLGITLCLDSLFTDGVKVVSFTHLPRSVPQKHYFSSSGVYLC
jgi:hypothetical protein